MTKILVAYNDSQAEDARLFFESCADDVKQCCFDNGLEFTSICSPNLTEENICENIQSHKLCFIAAHGDAYGVYNENDEDVVSTRTTNYGFNGKGFYAVSCSCGQELRGELLRIGLKIFIGYNDEFRIYGNENPFRESAMSGLKHFLSGENIQTSRHAMLEKFDEEIEKLNDFNPMAAQYLLHDKEALVFSGEDDIKISDLI